MIRKESEGVQWLEFELLSDCKRLRHGVFTRHGGSSMGPFSSLNVSTSVGDDPSMTFNNRKKIEAILKAPLTRINMHHGKNIHVISEFPHVQSPECDAIATHLPNVGLMITHADCQAAIFYEPIKNIVANVHSGWRGSVQNIYKEVIETLKTRFGTNPKDLLVGVSPSLGPQNSQFVNHAKELPEAFLKYQIKPNYFDFWKITLDQLVEGGISENHIQIAGICTYESASDFFSHRRDKLTGRNATVATLI